MKPNLGADHALPPGVAVRGPTAWHRLDPLTKLTLSVATVVAVVTLGGVSLPALLGMLAVLLPAATAGVLPRVLHISLLLALPLAVSVAVVNILFTPTGSDVVAELGPLRLTSEGVRLAAEVVVRVLVMAGAVTLYYLTTRPDELVASLQAHGAPARLTFVIHGAVAMIPRLAERAAAVTEAQRARGLDSEGSLLQRVRGVSAVAAPTVSGAIAEVEQRTLALEVRGFSRPGRHTLLWAPRDSPAQRIVRWCIIAFVALLVVVRLTGWASPW
ncbi:MAG TPA: energy-coupling factor transporter transmembrane component T [Candidatus Limnocylindrales bacterium]|nr:energy-coupling factor transporter transmembrane component T [Candidatus Limnocylindrales bacterium]